MPLEQHPDRPAGAGQALQLAMDAGIVLLHLGHLLGQLVPAVFGCQQLHQVHAGQAVFVADVEYALGREVGASDLEMLVQAQQPHRRCRIDGLLLLQHGPQLRLGQLAPVFLGVKTQDVGVGAQQGQDADAQLRQRGPQQADAGRGLAAQHHRQRHP
ncbi:hypothetical [Chromobacterium violaceum ATCC 12472]|uniref:Uncharacterized protein n=1 Tax=Chromobacterium violaceum (strain ATCC 12472 / DSM 30191 / JCM 1249 / CCUG 213 / NBRC 12614 / NCIMB 9131 / NCTC 9757 / MK) TaxID=243365 RepID=Q7NPS4_CHRVO|nr:hypothetical [Chromobacterium violaceum ATCC 12472]